MKGRILWVIVGCFMLFSLVLVACTNSSTSPKTATGQPTATTPAATTSPTTASPTTTSPTTASPTTTSTPTSPATATSQPAQGPLAETATPQYGGTLDMLTLTSPTESIEGRLWPAYQQFMGADWTRGMTGSGVTNFAAGSTSLADGMMPLLAESWTQPKLGVWVMKIRQGVHWQNTGTPAGDIMGGREMTAKDVVDAFNWQLHDSGNDSWIHVGQPAVAAAATINQTGPWEVTIKTPVDWLTSWTWIIQGAGYFHVYPVPVAKAYNQKLTFRGQGWSYKEVVGTGPYMIQDVVAGASRTWVKNPDYWQTDPIGAGKGNKLPYLDKIVELYLPDPSTQKAAFRTGKIASLDGLTQDDYDTEKKLHPDIMSVRILNQTTLTRFIEMDTRKAPFNDVRVRQALMYATDFQSLKNGYYGGNAEIDVWPLNSNFKNSGYVPLDKMPQEVQDLYTYNPDKAKQLLAEAGYPNGFKATILVDSTANGPDADEVSIYKAMWAKVGITLNLNIIEHLQFVNKYNARDYGDMIYRMMWTTWPMMFYFSSDRGPSTNNLSFIDDPIGSDKTVEDAFQSIQNDMGTNMDGVYQTMRDLRTYLNEQAFVIPRPTPYMYNVWQPWLHGYSGFWSLQDTMAYPWIDQKMKTAMGQ